VAATSEQSLVRPLGAKRVLDRSGGTWSTGASRWRTPPFTSRHNEVSITSRDRTAIESLKRVPQKYTRRGVTPGSLRLSFPTRRSTDTLGGNRSVPRER